MSADVAVQERSAAGRAATGVIDCDIHPNLKTPAALNPFLPRRWCAHAAAYGNTVHGPFYAANPHPLYAPHTSRRDAWPPGGGLPGSDLAFMRAQHLDPNNIACGIMIPLFGGTATRNLEFGAALCSAVNDWQIAEFISQEPRLRGSIQVPAEDAEAAVAEIERHAGNPGFVQVQVGSSTIEPVGRKRYWPIFAAAERAGLPIGMHVGGSSGHPRSGGGWPSFYVEAHYDLTHTTQAQITSMVLEGVFERFPDLKVALIEGGFAWAPPLGWRLDRLWEQMRDEVPHVKRPPSEYMRQHLYYTTQPMEEPDEPDDMLRVFAQIGWDRVMFSTDYPHWDFDDPRYAIRANLPEDRRRQLFRDNAAALYRLG